MTSRIMFANLDYLHTERKSQPVNINSNFLVRSGNQSKQAIWYCLIAFHTIGSFLVNDKGMEPKARVRGFIKKTGNI